MTPLLPQLPKGFGIKNRLKCCPFFSLAIPFSQALFLSSFSLIIKIQKKYAWVGWSWASFSITLTPMILCLQYVKEDVKKFQTLLHNPCIPYTWPVAELVAADRSTKSHFLTSSKWKKTLIWGKKKNSFEVFMAFLSPPPHFRAELFTYLDFLSSLQPFRICKHWTRSLFPQLTTTNRLHVYWWNRWNRQIWIFPSIPNTDTMYINSGAIHVHSATGVLTVRGDKQLSLRGGRYIRGESIDTSPGLRGGRGKKKITAWNGRDI